MKRLFNILLAGTLLTTGLVACEKSVEDVHYVPTTSGENVQGHDFPRDCRSGRD